MAGYYHEIHGNALHEIVIDRLKRYIILNGGKVKDPAGFNQKYNCACQPDAYFEFYDKKRGVQLCVAEVETNPTKHSRETKWNQYKASTAGIAHLIILDLGDLIAWKNWEAIDAFIAERMPFEKSG